MEKDKRFFSSIWAGNVIRPIPLIRNNSFMKMQHKFVEIIPDDLETGALYISITYTTVMHKCCCGCGNEVGTPLTPNDWQLTFDGETITLFPSIGDWSLPCQSHYWIRRNEVRWAESWLDEMIRKNRNRQMEERISPGNKWRIWGIFGKNRDRN